MEQFSLEKYLANPSRKVVTRDGRPVRIICTDMKSYNEKIVGLIPSDTGIESIVTWTQQGKQYLNMDTPNDLFFAPEKQEGWINIFKVACANAYLKESRIYSSKEIAESEGRGLSNYLSTIKIEWEE